MDATPDQARYIATVNVLQDAGFTVEEYRGNSKFVIVNADGAPVATVTGIDALERAAETLI